MSDEKLLSLIRDVSAGRIRDRRLSILTAALNLSEQRLKAAEAKAEALALENSKLKDQIDRLHSK